MAKVEHLVRRVYLATLEDRERLVKKVLLVHQAHKERLEYQEHRDFQGSLEKEDFLGYLECLA